MRRYADKQALREELTRLWTGLLDAQQGDCLVSVVWCGVFSGIIIIKCGL